MMQLLVIFCSFMIVSCISKNDTCAVKYQKARFWDSTLFTQYELDTNVGQHAINAFTDYATHCGQDSLCPVFFIKTAQVSRALHKDAITEASLNACMSKFPNSKTTPLAMFLKAQLYDEAGPFHNEKQAEQVYKRIISEFPHSEWALSAQGALKFIGKSDLEITNELLQQKQP
jgi:outer membrane protein assembly factor BamD (BamD/ComL family)